MDALAVVLQAPGRLSLDRLEIAEPGPSDLVVEAAWSGISTGTERLLYDGRMPPFPGMGYPLVPGYETVGRVAEAGPEANIAVGSTVFVPGASCYSPVRGLFGGAASRMVVPATRVLPISAGLGERGVLLALAATAHHALAGGRMPELIVGHGVLGRLMARLACLLGEEPPTVWERDPERAGGADGYAVLHPDEDGRRDYAVVQDASGDAGILDRLMARLAPGGEIVLAGFYAEDLHFAFPMAFMREARIRVAAQWQPDDLRAAGGLIESGRLSLDGLITHRNEAGGAAAAYATAFGDPTCLKMILDWRASA